MRILEFGEQAPPRRAHTGVMHHGLIDTEHQSSKALVTGVVIALILGIALGAAIGVGLARAFDFLDLEHRVRDFSNPAAAAPVHPGTLRA